MAANMETAVQGEADTAMNSDSESQEALEVILDPEGAHRRKSSLSPTTTAKMSARTSCFVHTLLRAREDSARHQDRGAPESPADKISKNSLDDHEIQSRHLSKNQLSDMAFGIRELSKHLSHIKVKMKVRRIFLLTKAFDVTLIKHTRDVTEWLLSKERENMYTVYVEDTLKNDVKFDAKGLVELDPTYQDRLKFWNEELCRQRPQTFDIVLALGGDGTVLYSSWLFQKVVPPVIPFALGSLGFLTRFDFNDYSHILTRAFHDGITVGLRLRFEATVMRSQHNQETINAKDLVEELIGDEADDALTHKPDTTHNILNDLVLDRGPNPTMSSIEVFGDDEHYTTLQADGVCIATPTGSTAYNLAAGGSLCHPSNPVILVTAICAHTLSFRPIILPDTVVLRIGVPYDARTNCWASFDGRQRFVYTRSKFLYYHLTPYRVELKPGDYVTVSASRFPFPSVLPLDRQREEWVDAISSTLNWNSRQRQKSFKEK
ncbi:MAG: hypothetical protein M1820_003302 [Bogoriella megaspora]|nr:MAG: hypothetical protein M1820_003302 [Bogoriella megaspora]